MVVRVFYIKQVQNRLLNVEDAEGVQTPKLGPPDKWTPLMFEPKGTNLKLEAPPVPVPERKNTTKFETMNRNMQKGFVSTQ
jgi:hypothetical protein